MIRTLAIRPFRLLAQLTASFGTLSFPLPDLGEKIKEGRVKKLYVKEGDRIEEFGKLADVESDKQFTEITSPEEGIIKKLYYREDETCQVGDIFLEIETSGSTNHQQSPKPVEKEKVNEPQPKMQEPELQQDVLASATVKMWARQHKINLSEVKGTGRKGRVLKEDIINFVQNRQKPAEIPKKQQTKEPSPIKNNQNLNITKIVMNPDEKELQKIVNYSNSIPHLYYQETFDVTQIQQIVSKIKEKEHKVSLLSILIKTFSLAIKLFPKMNSTYNINDPFNYKVHPHHNIILPFFQESGVSFNTIRNAEGLNIRQIETTIGGFQKSSLGLQNLPSGTICISHIGSLGAIAMNPLIYGQISCHASIGTLRELPLYESGKILKRKVIDVTMGCDHRVLDGATVARFTSAWRDYSENPTSAFLSMI